MILFFEKSPRLPSFDGVNFESPRQLNYFLEAFLSNRTTRDKKEQFDSLTEISQIPTDRSQKTRRRRWGAQAPYKLLFLLFQFFSLPAHAAESSKVWDSKVKCYFIISSQSVGRIHLSAFFALNYGTTLPIIFGSH